MNSSTRFPPRVVPTLTEIVPATEQGQAASSPANEQETQWLLLQERERALEQRLLARLDTLVRDRVAQECADWQLAMHEELLAAARMVATEASKGRETDKKAE